MTRGLLWSIVACMKPKLTEVVKLRLSVSEYKKVAELAARENRTISGFIRDAILRGLKGFPK